jgi:hypothetical protein
VPKAKSHERPNPLFIKTGEPDDIPSIDSSEEKKQEATTATNKQQKKYQSTAHDGVKHRKRRSTKFLDVYTQFSSYIYKEFEPRFKNLSDSRGVSKTELFNEAIEDILKKYGM